MNSTAQPPAAPLPVAVPPERAPLVLRIARLLALLGLVLLLTLLLGLALLSSLPLLSAAVAPLFAWESTEGVLAGWLTLGFILLVPIGLLVIAWRLRLRSWRWIGAGYLAAAPIVVYLAIDDPVVLHPTSVEEIAPAFPGAEKSYAVLMQYSKKHPSDEAKAFAKRQQHVVGMPVSFDKPAEWKTFLIANRAAIEADWDEFAPQRRWLGELNAFDRFADLGDSTMDADIIAFQVWRLLAQRTVQMAGLQMLDGHADEAIDTLLPMLEASRKLQPSARSLVRFMVAIVVEKMTLLYAAAIVEQGGVSPDLRAKLAATIAGGVRGEAGIRRLIGIEEGFYSSSLYERPLGELASFSFGAGNRAPARHVFNAISPLVYNPRRTLNLMGEINRDLQDLAARRALPSEGPTPLLVVEKTRPHFKNFAGACIADRALPAFGKVTKAYWDLNDAREKLAARLAATP